MSEVSYRVGRKSDDVEDLKSPSTAQLQQSLATAGKTLHSRAPKDDDDDKVYHRHFWFSLLSTKKIIYIHSTSVKKKSENVLKIARDDLIFLKYKIYWKTFLINIPTYFQLKWF